MLEGDNLPGAYRHPDQIPRPPPDRIARIGRPAGAIQGIIPQGRRAASPQPTRWRNRAGHSSLPPSQGRGASKFRHPSERRDPRRGRTTSNPYIVTPDLVRGPPSGWAPASQWMPERVRHDDLSGTRTRIATSPTLLAMTRGGRPTSPPPPSPSTYPSPPRPPPASPCRHGSHRGRRSAPAAWPSARPT